MQSRHDLERRVRELETQLAQLRSAGHRGVRYASAFTVAGLPFIAVATGPDPARGEIRGHARGIVAVGDIATGVVALGGLARGVVALGGLAIGLVTFGGASIGAVAAVGGLAIGSFALGGGAIGEHVVSATQRDPEAVAHFESYGLGAFCPDGHRRGARSRR